VFLTASGAGADQMFRFESMSVHPVTATAPLIVVDSFLSDSITRRADDLAL
jgi:hypothetical protein